jgi:hypothetical protein
MEVSQWVGLGQQCAVFGSSPTFGVLCNHGLDITTSVNVRVDLGWGDSMRTDITVGEVLLGLACLSTNVSLITDLLGYGVPRSSAGHHHATVYYQLSLVCWNESRCNAMTIYV